MHLDARGSAIIPQISREFYLYFIYWSPPGGSTAAQRFWSKEGCDKERSLEEQSFEIWVFLEAFVRILFSALSSAGSWILGFVLGKFLNFLGKVGRRRNQEQRKRSPARAAENMAKVSQEARKIRQKSRKIEPWPHQNRCQNGLKRCSEGRSY